MRDDELTKVVELLREPVPVRAEWRDALVDAARAGASTNLPEFRSRRRLTLSIPMALAAALAFAIAGAGTMKLMTRNPVAPPPFADATAGAAMLPVRFTVAAPNAASVSIVGDFNQWNPATLPMRRSADGRLWEVEVRLPLGRYSYAFMIDGRLAPDPAAPRGSDDDFGTPNSVLMVRGT